MDGKDRHRPRRGGAGVAAAAAGGGAVVDLKTIPQEATSRWVEKGRHRQHLNFVGQLFLFFFSNIFYIITPSKKKK